MAQKDSKSLIINDLQKFSLQNHLFHFQTSSDTVNIFTAIDFQKKGFFKPSKSTTSRQEFGYNKDAHWLYFEIGENPNQQKLILEVEYANLDNIELFEVQEGNTRPKSFGITGDIYPFSQRKIANNNYVFEIFPKAKTKYFLHINHRDAILSFYAHLTSTNYFKKTDRNEYLFWGIFTGIIFLIILFNSFLWYNTRDWIYFWYNIYITFVMLHLYADSGLGFQFIWHDFPIINTYNPVYLTIWIALAAQLIFMQYFIHQTRQQKSFFWLMIYKIIVISALILLVFIQFFDLEGTPKFIYKTLVSLTSYFVAGMIILATWSLIEGYQNAEKLVKLYSYALGVQFLAYSSSIVINILQEKGINLPFEIETYTILAFSALIDIAFFSYGLAYKYNYFQVENQDLALNLLKIEQEASQKIIETLEEERHRIAQDLHDDVGATLATAKGFLSTLTKSVESKEKYPFLLDSQHLLDKASDDLRLISHNLMPKNFQKLGLSLVLEETIRKISKPDGIQFDYIKIGQERKLSESIEIQLFRIATELLNNVLKHSQASEATLQLIYHEDYLNLIVEDNGQGFEANQAKNQGFKNIESRVNLINAEISIDSNINGTIVVVEMPYKK